MELTQMGTTRGSLTYSWRGLTFTIMRLVLESMFRGPFLWTWNQAPWTVSGLVLTGLYLDPITLYLDKVELATTGRRATIPRVLSWLTVYWMSSGRRRSRQIVCKDSN